MRTGDRSFSSRRGAAFCALGIFILFSLACVSGPPVLSPPPAQLESADGFGSLVLRRAEASAKTRFSFRFNLPDLGRIEALDVFGRPLSILIFRQGAAYFVLPSRSAYWTGLEEELMEKFLGFGLKAEELSSLLSGQWKESGASGGIAKWDLRRDQEGRVLGGGKDGFRFEAEDFYRGTSVPRRVTFSGPCGSGKVRILKIQFNRPARKDVFDLSLLKGRQAKSWPEIEAILNDEN